MNVPLARTIAGAAVAAALLPLAASPALAHSDDHVRRGSCSRSADWKLKVGPEHGRLQVEGEIEGRRGQTWRWRLYHNGSLSAQGTRTTSGGSGSWEMRRLTVDWRGTDRFTLRARNIRSNELCVGTVNY